MYLGELRNAIKTKLMFQDVIVNYKFDFTGDIYVLNNVQIKDDKIILILDDIENKDMSHMLLVADAELTVCVFIGNTLYENVSIESISVMENSVTLSNKEYDIIARLSV